ncbi:MAG: GAF domain-containing sensor histidine kinase [Cyanobacteriota bacterium]
MPSPDQDLFSHNGEPAHSVEKNVEEQRLKTLSDLGLLDGESVPIFEEATQTAAHLLDARICVLGLMDQQRQWFKSAVGLSRIGLMNELATTRQLPRADALCRYVVESRQVLVLNDASVHPDFADSLLVRHYGIRAYLSAPLIAANGQCIGTLAVLSLQPRDFSTREVELLELIARWSMSEYERNYLLRRSPQPTIKSPKGAIASSPTHSIKADLIAQMAQELRTPLTSILGMASVLNREIYGPLTEKQKEYLAIIHNSGQTLLSLINEILELGALNDTNCALNLAPIDIEMLCQQAFSTLQQVAQRREQRIRLTVEPGNRIWMLDKEKIRQMLYHLVFSVIQSASTESIIRVHVSRKQSALTITVWTSHPWLGEGLPSSDLYTGQILTPIELSQSYGSSYGWAAGEPQKPAASPSDTADGSLPQNVLRQSLGLMLSRQLAELHSGTINIQGSAETGYRYVVSIPQSAELSEME